MQAQSNKLTSFIERIWKFITNRYAPRGARLSFSASGEDLVLSDLLRKYGIQQPFYIDIGAHDPIFGNNTYLLYRQGGHGVLVEPNQEFSLQESRKRPRDICLNAGVGSQDGESTFYVFDRSTRSTFSQIQASEWEAKSGQKPTVVKRRIVSLDSLIHDYCGGLTPDLISIDAEGLDMEILRGYSWMVRPKIFCIELSDNIEDFMTSRGYRLVTKIFHNAIFAIE